MSTESAGGSGADDQTLAAIYEIALTMGGETTTDGPAVTTPAAVNQLNRVAEKALIDAGIVGKGGTVQRATLGCLACKLGSPDEGERGLSLRQASNCTDIDPHPIRRLLQRLLDAGVIASTSGSERNSVSARDRYILGPAAADLGIDESLEKPDHCGLEIPRDTTNAAAEQTLVDAGVVDHKSTTRRIALGCLGCRIEAGEEGAYGFGIEQCQGVDHSTVIRAFGPLIEAGALEAHTEDYGENPGGRARVIYTPAYSELGAQLRQQLEAPPQCGLRKQQEGVHE